jgi:mannosyltransferase OCH1-like enzyme
VGTGWDPNPGAAKANSIKQVAQADIAAYELLHLYGGLYVNTDMEPLKPIPDELLEHPVVLANEIDDWLISNAWMMSEPGQLLFDRIITVIPENIERETRTIDWKTGPKLLTRIAHDEYPGTAVLPARYCNPWTDSPTGQAHEDSICAHHWGHKNPDQELWATT